MTKLRHTPPASGVPTTSYTALARACSWLVLVTALAAPAWASDVSPPTVTIAPRDTTFATSAATIVVAFCDDSTLALTTRAFSLNGVNVRPSFALTGSSKPGCGAYAEYTGTVTLPVGKSWLVTSVEDAVGNVGKDSAYYRFGVNVLPKSIQVTQRENIDSNIVFTVANPTGTAQTFTIGASCVGPLTICTSRSSLSVSAGGQDTAQVLVHTGAPGGVGTVRLGASAGGVTDTGSVSITSGRYRTQVTPNGDSLIALPNRTGANVITQRFQVFNTGSLTPVAIAVSPICGSSAVPTCALVGSDTIRNLAPNTSQSVDVTFSTGSPNATGALALRATVVGWGIQSQGAVNVRVKNVAVQVTPDGGPTYQAPANQRPSRQFFIKNVGSDAEIFRVSTPCSSSAMSCTPSATFVTLAVQASAVVNVLFDAGVAGTQGTIRLRAALSADTTVAMDEGYLDYVSSASVTNTVSVTPDSLPVNVAVSTSTPLTFTLRQSSTQSTTYTFSLSCTGGISCGAPPTLPAVSDTLPHQLVVNATASATVGVAGVVTLTATAGSVSDVGSYHTTNVSSSITVDVQAPAAFSVPTASAQSATFNVSNVGLSSASYTLTVSCAAALQPCTLNAANPSPVTLDPSQPPTLIRVDFAAGTVGAAAPLTLTATRVGAPTDTDAGTVQVTRTASTIVPAVIAPIAAVRMPGLSSRYIDYFLFNQTPGSGADSFVVSLGCRTPARNCSIPANQTRLSINRGGGTTIPLTFSTDVGGLTGGAVRLTATAIATGNADSDSTLVGTLWFNAAALGDSGTVHDAGRCAVGCFSANQALSTVPYYSLGAPRAVALAYVGDGVSTRPIVQVNVVHLPGGPDSVRYKLQVFNGANLLTQTNGETVVRYQYHSATLGDTIRLSGQVDVSSLLGGVTEKQLTLNARIIAEYSATAADTLLVPVKVLVSDDRRSSIARGWRVAGLQRLVKQGTDAIVSDGAGSIVYFPNQTTNSYASPTGEYSRLSSAGFGVNLVYTRAYPDSSRAEFDYLGRQVRWTTRTLESTTFRYDGNGRLIEIDDPIRKSAGGSGTPLKTVLAYGATGLSSITEPGPWSIQAGGRITSLTVAGDTTLQTWTDPDGISTQLGYDAQRRLQTVTDRRGFTTTLGYDAVTWKLASTLSPSFTTVTGASAQLATTVTPWQTLAVARTATSSSPIPVVRSDTVRGVVTAPGGLTTAFTVDRWGQAVTTTVQPGLAVQQVTRVFRSQGSPNADSIVYHAGGVDRFRYSADGLVNWQQLAGEDSVRIQYGPFAQPTSVTGPRLASQEFFLGARGRVDSVRVAGTSVTRFVYDSLYRVTLRTDALGRSDTLSYDVFFGQLERTAGPGRRISQTYYDSKGRDSVYVADPVAARRTYYDVLNRVRQTRNDALGAVSADSIRYVYGTATLDSVVDPIGQRYSYQYNALGAVTQATDPSAVAAQQLYDAAGRVARTVNRRGDFVNVAYDTLSRVNVRQMLRAGTTLVRADSFFFAANGRVTVGSNATSRDSIYSDATGWTDSVVTRYQTDLSKRIVRRYVKGAYGQLDSVSTAYPGSLEATGRRFFWNATSNVLDSVRVLNQVTKFTYGLTFQTTTRSQPGNVNQTFARTTSDQAYNWSYTPGAVDSLLGRGARYDSLGRVSATFRPDSTGFGQRNTTYAYDARGRLTVARDTLLPYTSACSNPVNGDFGETGCAIAGRTQRWRDSLAFDALGNITASAGRAGTGAATYTNNRLTAWPGGFTYEFDADGNTTRRRKTTAPATDARFYWSPDGLLDSTVTSNGRRLTYEYNAFGQLARRRTNGTIDRHFAWDQDHLLIEMNGALTQRVYEYAWLPGTDQLLAVLCCETLVSAIYFAYQDVQGSLVGLVSSSGSVFRRQTDSDPWGFVGVWGPTAFPAGIRTRWQGLMFEADSTQLYYVRARWYDPRTKRFMSPDPIGLAGGINPYAFAGNDPVNLGDPSGRFVTSPNGRPCSLIGTCGATWSDDAGGGSTVIGTRVVCKQVTAVLWDCNPDNGAKETQITGVYIGVWAIPRLYRKYDHLAILYRSAEGDQVTELCGLPECVRSDIRTRSAPKYGAWGDYRWIRLGDTEAYAGLSLAIQIASRRYQGNRYWLADSNCFVYDVLSLMGIHLTSEQMPPGANAPCLFRPPR